MNLKIALTFCSLVLLMNAEILFSQDSGITNQYEIHLVEDSMKSFLRNIPSDIIKSYGIKDVIEIDNASTGNPIAVYSITNDSIIFTNSWRVPLIINNEHRALFTVIRGIDNESKIVDFGATLLAQTIFERTNIIGNTNNFRGMLRVYELKKDFLFYRDDKTGKLEFYQISDPDVDVMELESILQSIKK